jgi:hypothetical protein
VGESLDELDEFFQDMPEEMVCLVAYRHEVFPEYFRTVRDEGIGEIVIYKIGRDQLPEGCNCCRFDLEENIFYFQTPEVFKNTPHPITLGKSRG